MRYGYWVPFNSIVAFINLSIPTIAFGAALAVLTNMQFNAKVWAGPDIDKVIVIRQSLTTRHPIHNLSSMHLHSTQAFNVLARLQFGAYLCRLTVIEVLKVIVESVD